MKRIKSAPADISKMSHRKKPNIPIFGCNTFNNILFLNQDKKNEIDKNKGMDKKNEIDKNKESIYALFDYKFFDTFTKQTDINLNTENNYKSHKQIVTTRKKVSNIISGIISDTFNETNKYIPETDNYFIQILIEIINNFLTNKFNRKNLESLIISLFIRFTITHLYHDVLVNVKNVVHIN